ncbi:MAG TPA: protein kinase [Gemmatales bacterium]|nr:protein kinase [Gemmatales bacterium]
MSISQREQFVSALSKSGLIETNTLQHLLEQHRAKTPELLGQWLVENKHITKFQYKQLKAGRATGFLLAGYVIKDLIGSGAGGHVYRAMHTAMNREVALKILPAEQSQDKAVLERFYREARATAQLQHPNIVQVFDMSQGAGVHFLVMELVDGITLGKLLERQGSFAYSRAVNMAVQVAKGLQHAHERGIIHRDIKPANLIINRQGIVKILAMGLAKSLVKPSDQLTGQLSPSKLLNTMEYQSPEQSLVGKVDHRADIYSLGATLYAMMMGRPPYDSITVQQMMNRQQADLPNANQFKASVPIELQSIILKMLAKNPQDRFQSMNEVIEALEPWTQTRPVERKAVQPPAIPGVKTVTHAAMPEPASMGKSVRDKVFKKKSKAKSDSVRKIQVGFVFGVMVVAVVLIIVLIPRNKPEQTFAAAVIPASNTPPPVIPTADKERRVKIKLIGSDKFIGIKEVNGKTEALLELQNERDDPRQQWTLRYVQDRVQFYNKATNHALDATTDLFDETMNIRGKGTSVIGYPPHGKVNQDWYVIGNDQKCKFKSRDTQLFLTFALGQFQQQADGASDGPSEWTIVEIK